MIASIEDCPLGASKARKHGHTLTQEEAILLLPCDDATAKAALFHMEGLCPANECIEDLERQHAAGALSRCAVMRGEEPVYVIWYAVLEFSSTLTVSAASVKSEHHFTDLLNRALNQLAREHSCAWIEIRTRRRGLARVAQGLGYKVDMVTLLKKV